MLEIATDKSKENEERIKSFHIFKKDIDKLLKVCYNINVNKTNKTFLRKVGIALWKRKSQKKTDLISY